ncbi:MAG: hypothetical protein AAFQ36_12745 [Pseudomonadota bacterium]
MSSIDDISLDQSVSGVFCGNLSNFVDGELVYDVSDVVGATVVGLSEEDYIAFVPSNSVDCWYTFYINEIKFLSNITDFYNSGFTRSRYDDLPEFLDGLIKTVGVEYFSQNYFGAFSLRKNENLELLSSVHIFQNNRLVYAAHAVKNQSYAINRVRYVHTEYTQHNK